MTRHTRVAALLALLVAFAAVVPAGVVAQEDSIWDGFGDDDEDVSITERVSIVNEEIGAYLDKAQYTAASFTTEETEADRAERYGTEFADTYREHNETLETYANSRFSGNASEYDVIAFEFTVGDATANRYLIADANDSTANFSNSRVVNATDRSVDYEIGLNEFAAKNAPAELEYFASEYAAEDRDIDTKLLVRMSKRYGGDITLPEEIEWP